MAIKTVRVFVCVHTITRALFMLYANAHTCESVEVSLKPQLHTTL